MEKLKGNQKAKGPSSGPFAPLIHESRHACATRPSKLPVASPGAAHPATGGQSTRGRSCARPADRLSTRRSRGRCHTSPQRRRRLHTTHRSSRMRDGHPAELPVCRQARGGVTARRLARPEVSSCLRRYAAGAVSTMGRSAYQQLMSAKLTGWKAARWRGWSSGSVSNNTVGCELATGSSRRPRTGRSSSTARSNPRVR